MQRQTHHDAFNNMMKAFVSGTIPTETSKALSFLSPSDITLLKNLDDESDRIVYLTSRFRACNFTNDNATTTIAHLFQLPPLN
ncbi:hypothetical protein KIN20_038132 [Parelaphostrongylus tenuis]|uniref:Uncharacterized protein n=1 Tax=Parelaphostrongylus tenuis TaxID=148309 RepID=A0AAD5REQ1_PARTN|nr:hypothetical protein KIN20_038132 [Parelaphostrongylus tenuis]